MLFELRRYCDLSRHIKKRQNHIHCLNFVVNLTETLFQCQLRESGCVRVGSRVYDRIIIIIILVTLNFPKLYWFGFVYTPKRRCLLLLDFIREGCITVLRPSGQTALLQTFKIGQIHMRSKDYPTTKIFMTIFCCR